MIPKTIHYCWFGRNPKPENVLKCIQTWKDKMPDYEIKEWNEDNFDVNYNDFTKEAYQAKKYAFVSDVARLYALYIDGGIYLDTDIEVKKSFTPLLANRSFVGWEDNNLGTGVLASEKETKWLYDFLNLYKNKKFIYFNGNLNDTPNPYLLCKILKHYGLKMNHSQDLLQDNIAVYPIEYLCAHNLERQEYIITDNTYCVHHYSGSWTGRKSFLQKLMLRVFYIFIKFKSCIL